MRQPKTLTGPRNRFVSHSFDLSVPEPVRIWERLERPQSIHEDIYLLHIGGDCVYPTHRHPLLVFSTVGCDTGGTDPRDCQCCKVTKRVGTGVNTANKVTVTHEYHHNIVCLYVGRCELTDLVFSDDRPTMAHPGWWDSVKSLPQAIVVCCVSGNKTRKRTSTTKGIDTLPWSLVLGTLDFTSRL
ncbi:hypothetical protein K504DRAFT_536271, partial [Pleomassaria siparia CBS 279.74]